MSVDALGEPMTDGPELGDAFETAKSFFDDVLVEVEGEHFVLGQRAGAEDAGVAIELFGLGQDKMLSLYFRSEEHTSELQSLTNLVCRLLLEKKKHENAQK